MLRLRLNVEEVPFISLSKIEWYAPQQLALLEQEIKHLQKKKPYWIIKIEQHEFPEFSSSSQVIDYHNKNHFWHTKELKNCSNPICAKLKQQRLKKEKNEKLV